MVTKSTCYQIKWSTDGALSHTTAEVRDAGSNEIVYYRDTDGEWTPEKGEVGFVLLSFHFLLPPLLVCGHINVLHPRFDSEWSLADNLVGLPRLQGSFFSFLMSSLPLVTLVFPLRSSHHRNPSIKLRIHSDPHLRVETSIRGTPPPINHITLTRPPLFLYYTWTVS